ncbi:hypothetical protein BN946_scf185007.g68 [Trametes cinnabarina]|uniref:Alpha-MPP n=1 Tax=Pycnoporus cinnabarinus TaxID=5643 RepID=A0A060SLB4_PYCCI|nr:hypothetical protein BN946_scf185007.g68 [Trametes cinnabarina]
MGGPRYSRAALQALRAHTPSKTSKSLKKQVSTEAQSGVPLPQITTLPNGLRVATESTPGHFSSVGLYVDAGSRYERPDELGVSHFLDRMAFKTTRTRSEEQMAADIDALGGQILCSSARESIMYQSSHFHQGTPLALSLISDTVLNPAFLPEELEAQREAARYEIREVSAKPEMILPEVLHHVAYGGKGLGNPLLCPEDRIDLINDKLMRNFMRKWYTPERMVIAGAGMEHQELVELADKHFSRLARASPVRSNQSQQQPQVPTNLLGASISSPISAFKSLTRAASSYKTHDVQAPRPINEGSTYTGGHRFIHDPESEFNHVYLAYEGVGIHDDDVYTVATMQVLLGGPGKGMYSRLYTHILNRFPQIDHCASFHHIYTDSSLFGLFASFLPSNGRHADSPAHILPHLAHQLSLLLYSNIPSEELSRAKNQLKSSLMMALESRAVEVEDLGRQILVHGRKVPVSEMCEKIDAIEGSQIRKVAARIFGPRTLTSATVIVQGREDVGDYRSVLHKYGLADV